VIPLSKTEKRDKYHHAFNGNTGKESVALLSQLKAIDSVRLRDKIGYVSEEDFEKIKIQLSKLMFN
jgi:mRNA-degrading endonuclease toxin of MazEF toxin-antitoxin module